MEVLVAGGHGQVALRLLRLLAERGDRGRGLIRNPDHATDLANVGAEPVLCDLEQDDPRQHIGAAQAIVFAAGAGPGSGPDRKRTVDLGAAVKLIEAASSSRTVIAEYCPRGPIATRRGTTCAWKCSSQAATARSRSGSCGCSPSAATAAAG